MENIMLKDVVVEPMTEELILWRCIHGGPLSRDTIDQWSSEGEMSWERYRKRNMSLLVKLTRTYGSCAIIARDGDYIVGHLRFYPKAVCDMEGAGVHCLMTGSPQQKENPYQRKGIGSRMVWALIDWAKANGWERIEVDSFEDLPIIYEITGSAGYTFWEKLGFRLVDRHPHPALQDQNERTEFHEFVKTLEKQAKSIGVPPERARDRLVMRLDLT